MQVGVISDTHDNLYNLERAAKILKGMGVDRIIHLGDIVSPFTLARLAELFEGTNITVIFGNNCGEKVGLLRVAESLGVNLLDPPVEVEISSRKFLLIHGWGPASLTRQIARALAAQGSWDGVLYGHTHEPHVDYIKGRLLLNPGETAGVLRPPTVALIETDTLKARIVRL